MDDTTLRTHVSNLRKILRDKLRKMDLPSDPIPFADPGGYRLDLP